MWDNGEISFVVGRNVGHGGGRKRLAQPRTDRRQGPDLDTVHLQCNSNRAKRVFALDSLRGSRIKSELYPRHIHIQGTTHKELLIVG